MDYIKYEIDEKTYRILQKYIKDDHIHITPVDRIEITLDRYEAELYSKVVISVQDFIAFDNFLLQKGLKCSLIYHIRSNILSLIHSNYVDGLDYLLKDKLSEEYTRNLKPLHYICRYANLEMMIYIIQHTSLFNLDYNDFLPLEFSLREAEIIEYVLDNIPHSDINFLASLIHIIQKDGPVENFILFMEVHQDNFTMLFLRSIQYNRPYILEYLTTYDINIRNIDPMENMDDEGDYTEVLRILLYKEYLDEDDINALFQNSFNRSREFVEMLIENGADVEAYGENLYKRALEADNRHLTEYLKESI